MGKELEALVYGCLGFLTALSAVLVYISTGILKKNLQKPVVRALLLASGLILSCIIFGVSIGFNGGIMGLIEGNTSFEPLRALSLVFITTAFISYYMIKMWFSQKLIKLFQ